jgi:putative acetyltransferase
LLKRLEAEARAAGHRRLTIETGIYQRAAIRFYEKAGFIRCAAFGPYAAMVPNAIATSAFYEKAL